MFSDTPSPASLSRQCVHSAAWYSTARLLRRSIPFPSAATGTEGSVTFPSDSAEPPRCSFAVPGNCDLLAAFLLIELQGEKTLENGVTAVIYFRTKAWSRRTMAHRTKDQSRVYLGVDIADCSTSSSHLIFSPVILFISSHMAGVNAAHTPLW